MPFTFTIITSTLNCADALGRTAISIRQQAFGSVQWIIVDGSSTDETLDVINDNSAIIDNWISEPDSGIYDAWNKACRIISGEWVIFMGAGDVFCSPETLRRVHNNLRNVGSDIDLVYGNVAQIKDGKEIYRYGEVDLKKWEIFRPKIPAHQGVFQRARLFISNEFDTTYKIAADTKFLLSVLPVCSICYFDIDICDMEPGGVSADPRYILVSMREHLRIEKELDYTIPLIYKMQFIFMSYFKHLIYKLTGDSWLDRLSGAKRWLKKNI